LLSESVVVSAEITKGLNRYGYCYFM